MSCIFCRIAAKEIKSSVVHESDSVFAFDDNSPQAPVHVLVIPKRHMTEISELEGTLPEIFKAIQEVAKKKGIDGTGFRTVLNRGKNAGQAVDHLHFHVLGGRGLHWPPG
jgi:histidine triad (HIT) family protein